jgi:hypothetical protein
VHYSRAVLLSPLSVDTNAWPAISPLSSSSGSETADFAEHLNSFSGESSSTPEVSESESNADYGSQNLNSVQSTLSPRSSQTEPARSPAASRSQTVSTSSDRPSTSGKTESSTSDEHRSSTDRAHRGAAREQDSPTPAQPVNQTPASNPVAPQVPANLAGFPIQTGIPGTPFTPSNQIMRSGVPSGSIPVISRRELSGIHAAAAGASDPLADTTATVVPSNPVTPLLTADQVADHLAFAVKVRTANSLTAGSRLTGTNPRGTLDLPTKQTASGTAAGKPGDAPNVKGADAQSAKQDSDGNSSSGSQADGTDAKIAQKQLAAEVQTQPGFGANMNSLAAHTVAANSSTTSTDTPVDSKTPVAGSSVQEPIIAEKQATPVVPMKDITVRVESAQGETVDVRIAHRAGDLQVAVNSANGDTTQGLRHGLSELSNKLNDSGYHAEVWHPGQPAAATESSSTESGNSHRQSSGDSQSNSGSSQQDREERDNQQSNRPRWVQELASNLAGEAESTGQSHGLIR